MKIIIEGAGQVGSHLAKMLSHEGGDITVIDDNELRLQRLTAVADVVTVLGDPTPPPSRSSRKPAATRRTFSSRSIPPPPRP